MELSCGTAAQKVFSLCGSGDGSLRVAMRTACIPCSHVSFKEI